MKPVGTLLDKYQNIILKGFDPVSAGGFTQVPNCLLQAPHLSLNAKIVYAQLLHYAWTNNYCYPGQVRMAEDLGTNKSTLNRTIQELQKQGWLEIERRGQGKTNIYTLKYVVNTARVVDKRPRLKLFPSRGKQESL